MIMSKLRKNWQIVQRRIKNQGIWTTLLWAYGRGMPAVTGIPILKFSQVTPELFVGPQFRKNGLRHLHQHGIHAVVNMRIERDDRAFGLAPEKYCHLPTVDDQAPSIELLQQGIEFIDEVISSGGKVYIHCGAGVGRAPTMAAAYLISTGLSLETALEKIRRVRPFIYIMPPQMAQLVRFSSQLNLSH
jgi:protein-tyrosine phosphatase